MLRSAASADGAIASLTGLRSKSVSTADAVPSPSPSHATCQPCFIGTRAPPPDINGSDPGFFKSWIRCRPIGDEARCVRRINSQSCNVAVADACVVPPTMHVRNDIIALIFLQVVGERLKLADGLTSHRQTALLVASLLFGALDPERIRLSIFLKLEKGEIVFQRLFDSGRLRSRAGYAVELCRRTCFAISRRRPQPSIHRCRQMRGHPSLARWHPCNGPNWTTAPGPAYPGRSRRKGRCRETARRGQRPGPRRRCGKAASQRRAGETDSRRIGGLPSRANGKGPAFLPPTCGFPSTFDARRSTTLEKSTACRNLYGCRRNAARRSRPPRPPLGIDRALRRLALRMVKTIWSRAQPTIHCGAGDPSFTQHGSKCRLIDKPAARETDKECMRLHQRQLRCADQVLAGASPV